LLLARCLLLRRSRPARARGLAADLLGLERARARDLGAVLAVDRALVARGLDGSAHAPAMKNEQVRGLIPARLRHELHQILLDLDRIFLPREAEALRQPLHVRIDD